MKLVNKTKLLIWGISNVGKTTIGCELAKKLNCRFYDIDNEIIKVEVQIIFKKYFQIAMIDLMKKKR